MLTLEDMKGSEGGFRDRIKRDYCWKIGLPVIDIGRII